MGISNPNVLSPVVEQDGGFELVSFDHILHSHPSRETQVICYARSVPEQQESAESSEIAIQPYNGKGKGRALDFDQGQNSNVYSIGQDQLTTSFSALGHQRESCPEDDEDDEDDNDDNVHLLKSNTNTWLFTDPQFERRHYLERKAQRIRLAALYSCRAVVPERCRIHGAVFEHAKAIEQESFDVSSGDMSASASVYQTPDSTSSETLCGTMLDDARLVEEGGLAAEIRRRDESSLRCVEGWVGITIFVLGVVAIVMFAAENA